ncbi:hypothetical protein WJ96_05580 [Burkholderia ubonensis]|uniref:Uncharacterized protein n=1 Tax=Burkholderia ubonensis TaxID=101571 RepID=A0AAW3MYG9_9BURK|nr:hypothetical protein [Burkholderia ubonensis]KVP75227.1 hypothetical protein WJ93_07375 [Burkholderia ubonensis]KVP96698.1 hypothetical protein WJ97_12515 [Burkholderia ubonensis]KVP98040.1 hypothetical protein WJ96_05580 [Burkholderia ubonensis]KVZ92737.1 hypothetical protein WL25_17240 [Burkholderia ubonensis]
MHVAKLFQPALPNRLDAPFGANLTAGISAETLAREFREGLTGLLNTLAAEAADSDERGRPNAFSLCQLLMEVWTAPDDDHHLKTARGKTREEWLAAPIWAFAS